MNMMKLKSAGLACAAAFGVTAATLLATAAPSYARNAAPESRTVVHRDLDLATDAGRRALDARVRQAASALCLDPRDQSLSFQIARKACFDRAVTSAERSIARAVARDNVVRNTRSAAAK